MLNTVHCDIQ